MKRADLERLKGSKLVTEMRRLPPSERYAQGSAHVPDRREQRRLDRERGLIPFALKLDSKLVDQLRSLALERGVGLDELVDSVLRKGLAAA